MTERPLTPEAGEAIAAIATPVGVGALAIVRMSGRGVLEIADRVFRKKRRYSVQFQGSRRVQRPFRHPLRQPWNGG